MTHVVVSGCVDCKYQECVAVCPVDAFREAETNNRNNEKNKTAQRARGMVKPL